MKAIAYWTSTALAALHGLLFAYPMVFHQVQGDTRDLAWAALWIALRAELIANTN